MPKASLLLNAGSTQTLVLLPFRPAVDAIRVDNCTDPQGNKITTDQRGIKGPQGPACDIGAFELVEVPGSRLTVWFTLRKSSNGIHPLTDKVTLQIANYNVTDSGWIAPSSSGTARSAPCIGRPLTAPDRWWGIIPLGNNNYQFDAAGSPVVRSGVTNR